MAETIVSQVCNHPDAVMELALSNLPKLSMDASSFGEFAQQMSELGLIFDITFTDEQLLKLPDWMLVDEKITLSLSCIYPTVHLPKPPSSTTGSVNGTVVVCQGQVQHSQEHRWLPAIHVHSTS